MTSKPKQIHLAPYRKATLNTPLFHFTVDPCLSVLQPALCIIYWLRWQLARPFQVRLLPRWMPRIAIPGLTQVTYLTYGELLLALPLLFLIVAGYYFMFAEPNVELSGNIASYALIAGFLTANKSSSIFSFVFGIPFERMLGYHKLCSIVALTISTAHTYLAFEEDHGTANFFHFAIRDVNNTLGSIIFVCLSGLIFTSFFPCLRRWNYDIWFWIHIGLGVSIALPWACHSVNLVWLPLYWFVLDIVIRYVVMTGCRYACTATLRKLQLDVVEVRFKKPRGFQYNPGQFVRIAVPKLTAFQFHPFSVSSAPHEEYVTLHVRALGNWSNKLMKLAEEEGNDVKIWLEGPYGSVSVELDHPRYGMVLCVCGGIGVTFCRSVMRSMLHDLRQPQLDKFRLVWAVRDYRLVEDLSPFRCETEEADGEEGAKETPNLSWVQADVFLTTAKSDDVESFDSTDDDQQMNTHSGRPNLNLILAEMREEAILKGITHIAVLGCGPRGLMQTLQEACRKNSKSMMECQGVSFDLHAEVFEF